MPQLTGSSRKKQDQPAKKAPLIRPKAVLEQLDSEFEKLKTPVRQVDEQLLWVYFHSCMRPALHWINGNPYTMEFPEGYQGERLAGLCQYLSGLQEADTVTVQAAREKMLASLVLAWPPYRDLAIPEFYPQDHSPNDDECPTYATLAAIPSLWRGDNWMPEKGELARALDLPQFACVEAANFHLAALALLYLNRQLRLPLSDLTPHGGN